MQYIDRYDFKNKRAIVRFDFNVPLNKEFQVTDDTRIRAAVPTVKKIFESGGSIIAMSHLGRPKGVSEALSLKHIIPVIEQLIGQKVIFANDCVGAEAAELAKKLKPGEFLLLENLRFYEEEEGKPRNLLDSATDEEKKAAKSAVKEKQKDFVNKLASLADCYVNDSFGTAHRAHASTTLIANKFPNDKMFGYIMNGEIEAVEKVLNASERPFTAILGGSKISTKIPIIEKLLDKVDNLIICGGMGFTFIKALNGNIGFSICEDVELAKKIMKSAEEKNVTIYLPIDVLASKLGIDDVLKGVKSDVQVFDIYKIPDDFQGLDAGPASIAKWKEVICASKTVLWNGPAGVFEAEDFAVGTLELGKIVAEATSKGTYSLVGGGDSVAAINKFNLADKVSYVSTGGGALLEYMEGIILPGIQAIQQ
ncbi:MAG: phosphoglycerate kinase [Prevotellaceae bacterium]|jgi:phosphoglycerate kinase|nr:phosphoglycerate kinase [Prevotellaceae bacterium]